jgi:maleylpyruvate isomerase
MKLYGYWRSSCTWRVRLALEHKDIPYETVPVNLIANGGEHLKEPFRDRNPMAQVPLLEIDEGTSSIRLAQSLAIIEYLEERWPNPTLLPGGPELRAKARELAHLISAGIQPLQNLGVLGALSRHGIDSQQWGADAIARGLAALERAAVPVSGAFLCGDALSVADICLVPQLYNARRFAVPLESYPTLLRVEAACELLPSFERARPERQPDAPPDVRPHTD